MPTLADYIDIESAAAARQWARVLARPDAVPTRQERFTPVETLLCLAASLLVNHRRYGGRTSHQAPEPVPQLAELFRRTPASILAKMANLDGSRANGARHEAEAAATLLSDPERLSMVYWTALASLILFPVELPVAPPRSSCPRREAALDRQWVSRCVWPGVEAGTQGFEEVTTLEAAGRK